MQTHPNKFKVHCSVKQSPWSKIREAQSNDLVQYLSNGIPKIVHQTWKDENIPEHWKEGPKSWKQQHKDYLQILWTDRDLNEYIFQEHKSFVETWTHFSQHIQRVDAARYFILRDFGGIYCDMDLMPNQNIDSYLEMASSDAVLVKSANEPCQTNMFMAARSPANRVGHDCLWSRMIKTMQSSVKDPSWQFILSKHFHVMMSTGPLALTQTADHLLDPISVLPKKRFNPFGILDAGNLEQQENFKQPLFYVLEGSSWHSWDSVAINLLLRQKWWVVTICMFILIGLIILTWQTYSHYQKKLQ